MLRVPFNARAYGSKIIVTTRSEVVCFLMGTIPAHSLKGLSDTDCWSLFKSRAFPYSSSHVLQNLERIGKRIVMKCQGLPLALKALGDRLSHVRDENGWAFVSESEIWELPQDKIDILQQLRRSYQQLPSHLKQCFGYCSIFPGDHEYNKESLIQLWMAEGFVQLKGIKQLEDLGEDNFDDLLTRSFFHFSHTDPFDDEPRYIMHGLIHDLSQLVTHGDSVSINASRMSSMSRRYRHVSITCDTPELVDFRTVSEFTRVRSLLFFGGYRYNIKKIPHDLFEKLKSLRTLDLSHTSITELPSSIGNSKHLRFLDLSWTCIQILPDTICSLCNLQTLNLKKCLELRTLPDNMSSLINLRPFNVSYSTALLRILPFSDRRFLDLPKCIRNLINLRDIDISLGTSFRKFFRLLKGSLA
eukprot:XP_015580897.1 putative disease resistance protein RGA3 isoform X1 [Ricinus communis]